MVSPYPKPLPLPPSPGSAAVPFPSDNQGWWGTPANDNRKVPRPPAPANDNWPKLPDRGMRIPTTIPAYVFGSALAALWVIRPGQLPGQNVPADWGSDWGRYECPNPGGPWNATSATAYAPGWPGSYPGGTSQSYCISGQFITEGPGIASSKGYYYKYGPNPNNYSHVVSYRRIAGSSAAYGPDPVWVPPQWIRNPKGDPSTPIVAPRINPYPRPLPNPGFRGNPWTAPTPLPPPGHPPLSEQPSNHGDPDTGPGPAPNAPGQPAPLPNPEPPPPRTKERKVALRYMGAYLTVGKKWGDLTEVMDFVDAVHKAMDPECRARPVWVPGSGKPPNRTGRPRPKIDKYGKVKGANYNWQRVPARGPNGGIYYKWQKAPGYYRPPSLLEKMNAVYTRFDCVDIAEALMNIAGNQLEDWLIGNANKPLGAASKKDNRPLGYGTGSAL